MGDLDGQGGRRYERGWPAATSVAMVSVALFVGVASGLMITTRKMARSSRRFRLRRTRGRTRPSEGRAGQARSLQGQRGGIGDSSVGSGPRSGPTSLVRRAGSWPARRPDSRPCKSGVVTRTVTQHAPPPRLRSGHDGCPSSRDDRDHRGGHDVRRHDARLTVGPPRLRRQVHLNPRRLSDASRCGSCPSVGRS